MRTKRNEITLSNNHTCYENLANIMLSERKRCHTYMIPNKQNTQDRQTHRDRTSVLVARDQNMGGSDFFRGRGFPFGVTECSGTRQR